MALVLGSLLHLPGSIMSLEYEKKNGDEFYHRKSMQTVDEKLIEMVCMRCGFTFGGQESGSVFSAAVCQTQASSSKHYIESLPLVLKDKRSCLSQGEGLLYSLLIARLLSGSRKLNWDLETIFLSRALGGNNL